MLRSDYKTHYKMYKAKKNVVYATMFTFAMLGGLGLTQNAKADTVANANAQPMVQTAVNSTVQATSQAIVNSAAYSVAPASQVSLASSSVSSAAPVAHTDQPASTAVNTFKVAQNSTPVTNVAQSYVQTNQNNQAQNVQGNWCWNGDLQPSTDKTIDAQIGKDYIQRMKLNISFDIDASQLKKENIINVAKLIQSSNNSGMASFKPENTSVPVYIKDQQIGYLTVTAQTLSSDRGAYGRKFSELDYKLKVTADSLNYIGTQHVSVNAGWLGTLNYKGSWSFRGIKDSLITFNLIGNGGLNKSYKIHYAWPNDIQFSKYWDGYSDWAFSGQFLSDNGLTNPGMIINNPIMKDADQAQLNIYQQSYGKSGDFSLDHNIQYAYRIRADKGNSVLLLPLDAYATPSLKIPLYNENGELIRSDKYGWNVLEDGMVDHLIKIPNKRSADNLSLDQLKAENYEGMLASQQSDGTVLVYANIPLKMIQIKASQLNDDDIQSLMNNSDYINYKAKDHDEAYDLAKQELTTWINGPLKGTPYQLNLGLNTWVQLSDPSVHPSDYIDVLDVNTGKVLKSAMEQGNFSSSMASGQSAVKLHVINATNGADLKQVTNFVDWPNQGKKASLSIPSLAGYQVVNDASEANAILSKLGKQGNVLTSATSVDYPAADQISNYYVIMNPVTEHATVHFIDQTDNNKELSHVDLSGAYNTPVTANGQINTMLTNYLNNQGYELVSNDLTGNHLYTDQAQNFNIVLRHKQTKADPDTDPNDAVKNITRTINVHNPDGSVKTTKQTARLTRTGTKDSVTNNTTWGAWSTGNWAEFDVPAIQDYTPSQAKVNAQAVDSNTQDQTIDVTYKANILTKDITFTVPEVIHRTDQHGKTTIDRNQTVTLKGTVTYNAATNQLVSYQIHSADFPEYVIPQIDGYTSHVQEDHIVSLIPDDTQFDKDAFAKDPSGYFNQIMKGRQGGLDHVIDATSVPQTTAMQYKDGSLDRSYDFYITYTANPQSAQVIYYDTILKKNVSTSTLNGVTDQTVNTDIKVPTNYVLVPGQNLPTTYTFKGSNNQNIIVNLTHATKDTTSTDANAHKTVTRTIIVNTPHDGTKTTKQDAHLTRSATLDLVTNQTAYGNWNTDQWAQYTVPAVAGYTPSQANVPQATVTGDTQNTTVTVNYTANPHVQVINYVGDGKVQHTQNVNGVTDQTVNNIPSEVPANWVLAPGAKVPTSVTFGPNDPQPIVVNIVHKTQDVTKSDEGAHKTITRTIHVNDPHHGITTTTQAANLTRPAWFDFVTNDVHYGNWNTGNWAEFDSPAVAGYTVNPAKVNAQTVTSDMKDTIVNVNYTANPQQVVLNFVDKSGNVIATHIYKGVTDGTAKIDAQVPTNWVLVKGQIVPTSYTFKPSNNTDIDVIIEHGTKDTSKTDKNAVRDVTRTININDPHKGTATTKQVAHLHRSATLDLVTNETTYGKWDTDANDWTEVAVPAVDGYTPNMTKVNAATVDENTKDQTIDVNYTANPQQVVLNFVDKAGNVIASQTYKGVTDGTASIDAKVPTNWVLVKGQTIPTSYTFKAEGNNDINVQIEHGMEDVSKTDEGAHKDVTRTIIVTNPDGKKNTTSQVAKLTRTAIKDLVTGNVTYGDWNTGNWDAFDTPAIAGYDATIKHVDAQAVNDKTEDATVNISYNALTHTQDINYVDDNGNVVGTQVVTGRTGETSDFTPDVPDGYSIVEGQNIPKNFTFGANDPKTLVIHVTKPNNKPVTPGTPTSDNTNSQTPADSNSSNVITPTSNAVSDSTITPSAPATNGGTVQTGYATPGTPTSDNTNSQTPADSNSSNVITPTSNAVSDSTITPSAPATNGGTVQTGYATPASAQTVTATPAAAIAPSAQTNNTQGQLPQTGDNNTEAIAGLTLAGMTGAILAAGALKRRHD